MFLVIEHNLGAGAGGTGGVDASGRKTKSTGPNIGDTNNLQQALFPLKSNDLQSRNSELRHAGISSLAFSWYTGDYLAIGFDDGYLRVLKFPSLQPALVRKLASERISDLQFSPNNEFLAAGSWDQKA